MLPFKETLHAKIHTYQTDTSGRFLHYKRILCFTRGLSAHGKLKIGASSGVVKELCFQELPMHSQEAARAGGVRSGQGCLRCWHQPGHLSACAYHQSPLCGGDRGVIPWSSRQVGSCAPRPGTLKRTWKATTQHSWQGFQATRRKDRSPRPPCVPRWARAQRPDSPPNSLLPCMMPVPREARLCPL